MATVRCQSVAVRTDAAEGTRNVVTTESALMAHLLTFIHVLADLHRSRSESIGAIAFESSFDVGTRSVAANIGNGAFVIICRNQKKLNSQTISQKLKEKIVPTHLRPELSKTNPIGHSQRKDPSVLTHSPPSQMPGMTLHSLRSSPFGPRPAPLGQSFSNSASNIFKKK